MTPRHADPTVRPARRSRARLGAALAAPVLLPVLLLGAAGPASAVPLGWSDPPPVSGITVLLLLVVAPLALLAVITLLTALPLLLRGQKVTPGAGGDQWFGGPVRGTRELRAPDTEESQAGGAGVRW